MQVRAKPGLESMRYTAPLMPGCPGPGMTPQFVGMITSVSRKNTQVAGDAAMLPAKEEV